MKPFIRIGSLMFVLACVTPPCLRRGLRKTRSFKRPFPGQAFDELTRIQAEAITQRTRPQPAKTNWAIGSMEWQAEQEKAKQSGVPDADRGT